MVDLNRVVGKAIAELRNGADVSQESLAFECELHPTYISQIERGLKSPTVRVLFRIAEALGMEASEVLRRVERKL